MQAETLSEILFIEKILQEFPDHARGEVLGHVGSAEKKFPVYRVSVGSSDPKAPVLALTGGVHGLERIGAQVVLSLMSSLLRMQLWDQTAQELLKKIRIVFIPTVNPWGLYNRRRSNAAGVDLMRNSPVDAEGEVPWALGGQRYSPKLPWYRGTEMQLENTLVIEALRKEFSESSFCWSLDIHSGFGWQDQIWFPYAKSTKPFPDVAQLYNFKTFFESAHPYHFYKIEPQSYRTHGDLWDYAYELFRSENRFYVPLTLELGSWNWVKKNPLQILNREGLFHPLKPHRQRRILRRHWTLFDFMMRMTRTHEAWAKLDAEGKQKSENRALELWYER